MTERAEEPGRQGGMGPRKQGDEQVRVPLSILKARGVSLRQEGVLERLVRQPSGVRKRNPGQGKESHRAEAYTGRPLRVRCFSKGR